MDSKQRETNINWLRGDETAIVYTSDPAVIKKLEKNPSAQKIAKHEGDVTGYEFEIPVSLLTFRSGKRVMSAEEKARRGQALAAARQARNKSLVPVAAGE